MRAFTLTHPRLKLFHHPSYHPERNGQEPIWKRTRAELTIIGDCPSLEAQGQAIFQTVPGWSNEKIKSMGSR
jgi:hypothetical protein